MLLFEFDPVSLLTELHWLIEPLHASDDQVAKLHTQQLSSMEHTLVDLPLELCSSSQM